MATTTTTKPAPDASAADPPRYAMRHFSVNEISQPWGLSDDAVRNIFEKEPGVLVLGGAKPRRASAVMPRVGRAL
jgi:hypothetical protein